MTIFLYTSFMYLLTPFLLFRLWWKSLKAPAYRHHISERFSRLNSFQHAQPVDVWVHTVSLGEAIAATPFIEACLKLNRRILITTMTPTGRHQILRHFGNRVQLRYVPYDLPYAIHRVLLHYKPRITIIMETELWPNLIKKNFQQQVPIFLINARLSAQSLRGYHRFKFLFKPLLNQLTKILAQSPQDAARFIQLGARPARVDVLGNLKFEMKKNTHSALPVVDFAEQWGKNRPVVLVASTHDNEESQILEALPHLQNQIPNVLLLIAPRHPERFAVVCDLVKSTGFTLGIRSQIETITPSNQVIVLDSMGELAFFYSLSNYAFVGGSFVNVGGHNVLEPIAIGIPVFTGQHVFNFQAICNELLAEKALQIVNDAKTLFKEIALLHATTEKRQAQVARANVVLQRHQGVTQRYVERIEAALKN